ncbi:hypothetical protein [Echinicola shivajiensis]|uniref:hypothetical protein n=1 Tax=Echinicola shivajiensis TaxID=1035916 RepID=UPI001BFC6C2A|nr:hypothetical protein [Echinicola shivajiensis]
MNNILEIAILEMARQRGNTPFELYEVIKWIFPQDWQHFTSEIELAAHNLALIGKIDLTNSQDNDKHPIIVIKKTEKSHA